MHFKTLTRGNLAWDPRPEAGTGSNDTIPRPNVSLGQVGADSSWLVALDEVSIILSICAEPYLVGRVVASSSAPTPFTVAVHGC